MRFPTVINRHKQVAPRGAVYIGRGSIWGNPFKLEDYGYNRDKVLQLYSTHLDNLLNDPSTKEKFLELVNCSSLVCYCKPKPCHGDVMLDKLRKLISEQQCN